MTTDPIADLLTRIRNAATAGHPTINVPASFAKEQLLNVLKAEGYIDRIESYTEGRNLKFFKVYLRYALNGQPVIKEVRRLSRPGRRVYVSRTDVPTHRSGLGTIVISTSRGMMTGSEAKKLGVGGELVCSVF